MKKIILGLIITLAIFSCNVAQNNVTTDKVDVSFGVSLPTSSSRNLNALVNPIVDYTILEGSATYMSADNIPLTNNKGVFTLEATLRTGANYKFSQFTVKDEGTVIYTLDSENTENTTGFTVDTTGAVTPNPAEVYLNYQLPDEYSDYNANSTGLTLVEDFFTAENLTFKVKIPVGLQVSVKHYNGGSTHVGQDYIPSSKIVTLEDGDIYDMDTRHKFGTTNTANDNDITTFMFYAWNDPYYYNDPRYKSTEYQNGGDDRFTFVITDGNKKYEINFTSADYNMKEVIFNMGS